MVEMELNKMDRYSLPIRPRPGEAWIALNLSELDRPIDQALAQLEEMGFNPRLRYRQGADNSLTMFALLCHVQNDPDFFVGESNLWENELDQLAENFPPDCITSPRGLPRRQPVAA